MHLEDRSVYRTNSSFNIEIDIKIVTDGCHHVFEFLDPPYLEAFEHIPSKPSSPMHLGFEAHRVLQEHLDQDYDYFCYLEDDLIINDASFFQKLSSFTSFLGDKFLVLPQRYEISHSIHQVEKFFIDGPIEPTFIQDYYTYPGPVHLLQYGPLAIALESPSNPHAGCFFLSHNQLTTWVEKDYWLDRDDSFISPLESSATLGISKTFEILKPSFDYASWFELQHYGNSFHSLIATK